MKAPFLSLVAIGVLISTIPACTTLENRRDLYTPQRVDGPYTRMLREGIPAVERNPTPAPPSAGKYVIEPL